LSKQATTTKVKQKSFQRDFVSKNHMLYTGMKNLERIKKYMLYDKQRKRELNIGNPRITNTRFAKMKVP